MTKERRRPGNPRRVLAIVVVLAVLFLAAVFGAAWYFSDQLLDVSHSAAPYSTRVLAVRKGLVTLSPDAGIANQGYFAVAFPGGEAELGPAVAVNSRGVTRRILSSARFRTSSAGKRLSRITGHFPPDVGHVRYDVNIFETPQQAGIQTSSVQYPSSLGPMPAWFAPGASSTWEIAVHGLGSTRAEALRAMPVIVSLGMPVLDIGYRNDAHVPQSPDHLYHLGATEWLDLQSAVRYALHHGARHFVLYGYSMGGNIVESFMEHSRYASRVRAIVLDAPALDWYQILELAAEERNLPGAFAAVVERLVAWRLGMWSLDPVDHLLAHISFRPPTLLFQGSADSRVPPRSNAEFARKYSAFVTFVQFPGANHVQSWNVNPGRYDRILRAFLRRHLNCIPVARRTVCS